MYVFSYIFFPSDIFYLFLFLLDVTNGNSKGFSCQNEASVFLLCLLNEIFHAVSWTVGC